MKTIKKILGASIKNYLIVTFAALLVIPIVILGTYAYRVAKNNLIDQTETAMKGNTEVISYAIENNIKRENDVVKFLSFEDGFRKALERVKVDPYTLTDVLTEDIEPLIWYYLSSDTNIESIIVYSDLIEMDHMGDFLRKPATELEKNWYEFCDYEYSPNWMMDEEGGVYLIKALLDSATSSKRIGMIVLKVNENMFFSMANKSNYLENGIVITDRDEKVILHKHIKSEYVEEQVMEYIGGDMTESFHTADNFFLAASEKTSNGWTLFYYVDRNEIISDVAKLLSSVLVLALVTFFVILVVSVMFADNLSKRIVRINNMANEIKNGYFGIENKDKGVDEIGQLSQSMKDMADTLSDMVLEIERMNKEQLALKENDIHYREWLFDFVVEKNNDILAIVNEQSYESFFITANAESVLGIPLRELQKDIRKVELAQREGPEERLASIIERCSGDGEAIELPEVRFANVKTGEHKYYRGVIICTIDDGGKRLALAFYDRTQEIRKNHTLQEALNAAETANKAKTSFLANMSHDFRTPMNAITGFNLLIEKHAEDPDKVREYTRKIGLASQNLLSLLNDVLDMSKIESGKTTLDIKEVALGMLLEEINSVISFQAKAKNQEYIVKTENIQHDLLLGDKQRINEILVNILGNAIKYTPEGGRIEFTISESGSSSEGFDNVKFVIKDNGIGMKPEYKDKIFDAFSREEKMATKAIQGTGLGMAITKSLVELMGGTIRVESEEGKGSTFTVNLRLQIAERTEDIWKKNGINMFLGVNKNVEENSFFVKKLEESGLIGVVASSGMEALKTISDCAQQDKFYDFIVVDDSIEDMTPEELVKAIRARDKRHNSIIVVAADDPESIEEKVKTAGANAVAQKPVLEYTFTQVFEEMAGKHSESSREEANPLAGLKFLAAEDNDINADILTELMSMEGATVTRACDGQEVVEMFKEAEEGDYDMILMDIQMPVMNGYQAAAAIRALNTEWAHRIPIIAMTANAYADDVQQAFDAGMNAHVSKPIDIKTMEKTILEFKEK